MKAKFLILNLVLSFFSEAIYSQSSAHDIIFCGEAIPVTDHFVADKLMNIIRQQINYVNMPQLRARANKYFGIVEYYLHATGLPEDFKYLAIVESGFTNAVSSAGAAGFWQIMPETARDWGLTVNDKIDERDDIYKSTLAACKELARNYLYIKRKYGISSWVLTAAAYNHGIGNIENAIKRDGKDYFQMNLNAETAAYVYKIIAVKELFEYPEIYVKKFGYNVFSKAPNKTAIQDDKPDLNSFSSMTLKVNEKDGDHPENLDTATVFYNKKDIKNYIPQKNFNAEKVNFLYARIVGKYKNFQDGDFISFKLEDNLQVHNNFTAKGSILKWQGWEIDDRIYVDPGFGHNVILYDLKNNHGLSLSSLNKNNTVVIAVNKVDD